MPVAGVLDVDDRLEQLHRAVVAALGGELHGAAELERRRVLVAGLARLQALLDRLRQLAWPV